MIKHKDGTVSTSCHLTPTNLLLRYGKKIGVLKDVTVDSDPMAPGGLDKCSLVHTSRMLVFGQVLSERKVYEVRVLGKERIWSINVTPRVPIPKTLSGFGDTGTGAVYIYSDVYFVPAHGTIDGQEEKEA